MSRTLWPPAELARRRDVTLTLLAAACVAVVLGPGEAGAEADRSSAQGFTAQEGQRAVQGLAGAPMVPHRTSPTFRRILMQRGLSDSRQSADRRSPRSSSPAQAPSRTVAVFGDRFGQALASGLADASASDTTVLPPSSDEAGLTRSDFTEWLGAIRSRLAKPDRPNVAIVMLGSTDRQPIEVAGKIVATADPAWQSLYAARVDAVASSFSDAHVPLIWVGLPSVHSEEVSADFVRINGIVRDRVGRAGGTYVDSWEAFADDTGGYSPMGPDLEGDTVKLRKADGFGFTRAGARKLASFVESDLKRLQTAVPPPRPGPEDSAITIETPRDFDQALQIDVNAQIRREAGLMPEASSTAVAHRAVGPVIPLTAPLAPDGQLVSPSPGGSLDAQAVSVEVAKPGRADDFSWPRP